MGTLPAEPMTSRGRWMGRVGAGPAWSCSKGLEESAKWQRRQGSHSAERQNRGLGPGQTEAGSWRGVWAKPTSPRWRSAWVGRGLGGGPWLMPPRASVSLSRNWDRSAQPHRPCQARISKREGVRPHNASNPKARRQRRLSRGKGSKALLTSPHSGLSHRTNKVPITW